MASTTNNSGIDGGKLEDLGPDERYDDETEEEFKVRMEKKRVVREREEEDKKHRMPPCIG